MRSWTRARICRCNKLHDGVCREIIPRIMVVLRQWRGRCFGRGSGRRCLRRRWCACLHRCGGVKIGRGCFSGCGCRRCHRAAVFIGVWWKRGGALRGIAAAGSGATTSSMACSMNLAVGDSSRRRTGCLLCGDDARFGAARCAGGSLGMAFTGGACAGAVCGCCSDGCPKDGAEVEVELDEAAVCNGRDNVGVADGDRFRRGDGNLDLAGVGERARCLPYPPLLVLGSVSGTPP